MSSLLEITDATFYQLMDSDKPVLVDFWADWCQPCLRLTSVLENLANEYNGEVVFAKLNVDESINTAREYGIRSIPHMLLIKSGEIVDTLIGNHSKEKIGSFIEKNIAYT